MDVHRLRSSYSELTPQERAELYFAKALPERNEAMADALDAQSPRESYLQHVAELRIILFGTYWMSKLSLLCGLRLGKILSRKKQDEIEEDDEDDILEERGAALAVALKEFDNEHGGWLRGVIALLEIEMVWDISLKFGNFLNGLEVDIPFFKHLAEYRETLASTWSDMASSK